MENSSNSPMKNEFGIISYLVISEKRAFAPKNICCFDGFGKSAADIVVDINCVKIF